MAEPKLVPKKPTGEFIGVSWAVLLLAVIGFCVGIWHAPTMDLSEQGLYLVLFLFGLFAVVSIQKTIRDKVENVRVTNIYYGLSWGAVVIVVGFLSVCLYNADFGGYEKGFYAATMILALFAAIAVQKNVRDVAVFDEIEKAENPRPKTPAPGLSAPAAPTSTGNGFPPPSGPPQYRKD